MGTNLLQNCNDYILNKEIFIENINNYEKTKRSIPLGQGYEFEIVYF